jgi:preprotein translocase subunit SecE
MAKAVAVAERSEQQNPGFLDWLKAQPQRLQEFLKDVRAEMRKVVAPSRQEVTSNTIVVLVTVFFFAGFFFLVDTVFGQSLTRLIQHYTQH